MRTILRGLVCAAVLAACAGAARADTVLKPNDNVVVCGDSITEQRLYSVFIEDYLLMCQPASGLKASQTGWSGEAAPAFSRRIPTDVLPLEPTVATTCYGMNDGAYQAFDETRARTYHDSQVASIQALKAGGVRVIVLGSPGAVDSTTFRRANSAPAETYNQTLARFTEIDKQIAQEQGVLFADVHTPMIDVMARAKAKFGPQYPLAGSDGIHPQENGHLVMAYAYLKALGCDGAIGTITYDASTGKAQATAGHKVLESSAGAITLESTKYPFCFFGEADKPNSTRSVLEFLPFNAELNRYVLVVKNGGAGKVKVTWGDASREFDAADAGKGINLAAEFLDNPFSEPFKAVESKIRAQQSFETPLNKQLLHNLPPYDNYAETREAVANLRKALVSRDRALQAEAAAALVPVKHTIKVELVK